jgi:hypothetical protein
MDAQHMQLNLPLAPHEKLYRYDPVRALSQCARYVCRECTEHTLEYEYDEFGFCFHTAKCSLYKESESFNNYISRINQLQSDRFASGLPV